MHDEQLDLGPYRVVVNHEDQYSIWPAAREIPLGWRDGGRTGSKAECLLHIRETWIDMRPRSVLRGGRAGAATVPGEEG